jgi:hypothetical protein
MKASELLKEWINKQDKLYLYFNVKKKIDCKNVVNNILDFLVFYKPKVLNIAGNRESVCNGIGDKVYKIMYEVFKYLKQE